jgi:hypothetical protein
VFIEIFEIREKSIKPINFTYKIHEKRFPGISLEFRETNRKLDGYIP